MKSRGGLILQSNAISAADGHGTKATDEDHIATVSDVRERVQARLRAWRGGGVPSTGRDVDHQGRAAMDVDGRPPYGSIAEDRTMEVDEVVDIALACLGALTPPESMGAGSPPGPAAPATLTVRQQAVLRLVSEGLSNKRIARSLNITVPTVKNHLCSAMSKLNAENRTHAAVLAGQMRLL